jgi:hypothetical protein
VPIVSRGRRSRLPLVVMTAALAVAAAGAWGAVTSRSTGPVLTVSVEDRATGSSETILRLPLRDHPTWEIQWRHSVAGILVRDRFAWREGRMVLTDTLTPHLDVAGLGHTPGEGALRRDDAGDAWIAGIDRVIPGDAYRVRIGSARAPTVLLHAGRAYPLSAQHAGRLARIAVVAP